MDKIKALKILKDLENHIYSYCREGLNFDKDKSLLLAKRFYNHSVIVADISKKIAIKSGLDCEKSYILGLLHDIGRFNNDRFHGIAGYEIALEMGLPEVAKVALTHSFVNDVVESFHFPDNQFKESDIKKTEYIFLSLKLDKYDYMVRIADFMSVGDTLSPVSIEERLNDIKTRYKIDDCNYKSLSDTILNLKKYWDKELGCDLYDVLGYKSEIIR